MHVGGSGVDPAPAEASPKIASFARRAARPTASTAHSTHSGPSATSGMASSRGGSNSKFPNFPFTSPFAFAFASSSECDDSRRERSRRRPARSRHWPRHTVWGARSGSLGSPCVDARMNTRRRRWGRPKLVSPTTRCAHRYPSASSSATTCDTAGGCGGSSIMCQKSNPGTFSRRTQGTRRLRSRRKMCEHRPVWFPRRKPGRVRLLVLTS